MSNIYEEMLSMPENNNVIISDADIIIPAVNINEGEVAITLNCDPTIEEYTVDEERVQELADTRIE